MRLFRSAAAVVLMLAMLLPVAGCGTKDYEPVDLVPAGADVIGGMEVSEALRDWQIYCALDGNESTSDRFDETKVKFQENTGIDMDDIGEVLFFATSETAVNQPMTEMGLPAGPTYAAVILTGNFADRDLIDNIADATGTDFTEETYGDFSINTGKDGEAAVVKISNTVLLMGKPEAVKDVLDVAAGDAEVATGELMDTYKSLNRSIIRLAMVTPEDTTTVQANNELAAAFMPMGFQAFDDVTVLSLSADMGTQSITVDTKMEFSNADSASDGAEAIDTFIGMLALMATDADTHDMMTGIEVKATGTTVTISYDLTFAELAKMMTTMENGEGLMPGLFPDIDMGGQAESPESFQLPEDFDWSEMMDQLPEDFDWSGLMDDLPEDFDWSQFMDDLPEDMDWSDMMDKFNSSGSGN